MKETNISQLCRKAAYKYNLHFYRNNTGAFQNANGRWVQFGLCKGGSDLIGWKQVKITPDMVGETVAIFAAAEVKRPGKKVTKIQQEFIEIVRKAGAMIYEFE